MINEIDIRDWEILTEPLSVSKLNTSDLFSVHGGTDIFRHAGKVGNSIIAILQQKEKEARELAFVFPEFMEVFPWKASQKTKVNPTSN